ncbi:FAD-dependent oxidoreductase [Rhizobium grahamii]|uniref:FAD-dependent oxidoreductase n=1 Tax=Rhizobium grahamii TaxID=1120045 RepID=A0A5Q0CAA9_9HYPH|nr:FAD-dependent oxidoreductase [Rhizobium grahamii]QFY60609.1 FAD-dependent oxidoreductase [Rhizobium grahamii]
MAVDFKYLVVGRGMMGAAAARHLARQADGVSVIGPDEPVDHKRHDGVFASHYDEGRITRSIDRDPTWALLANRSIARYDEIAKESGIDFYTEAGCMIAASEGSDYLARTRQAAERLGVETAMLDPAAMASRFPQFAFPDLTCGIFEGRGAGYISPRKLVKAQSLLAERAGASIVRDHVVSINEQSGGAVVETAGGSRLTAEKVLLAAGGFSISENLLRPSVDMSVKGRTVALFEVSEEDAALFAGMPSLILEAPGIDIYLLPSIRYPDGKLYLKIGGDPDDHVLRSDRELRNWFRTDEREVARDHLARIVADLVPRLRPRSVSTASCVVSHTPSGLPMIGYTASPAIAVLTGCAGTSAKSSDELGRLGAELLLRGEIGDQGYATDFRPYFR